jgi:hypothetical protein
MEPSTSPSKKISQNYFDQIVSENMNDFEMGQAEAIEDAINQLKSQGADLSMICKFSLEERAQLIDALKNLHELLSQDKQASCLTLLNLIRDKFTQDLSFRCLATNMTSKPNAYEIFTSYLVRLKDQKSCSTFNTDELNFLELFFKTFDAYIYQQSDVLNSDGLKLLIGFTNTDLESRFEPLLQYIIKCICSGCLMNEPNRQFLVENGLCENLIGMFKKHKRNEAVLCQVCQLIRCLLLDDDLRVEYGKAHEHAKYIASELNGIDVLLQIGLGRFDLIFSGRCL